MKPVETAGIVTDEDVNRLTAEVRELIAGELGLS
jgi:hypothetical protein